VSRPLEVGERVLLLDAKRRRYLVTLVEGGEFHSHAGVLPHAELIGQPAGVTVKSTLGGRYTAVRPTLSEYVLEMPRGAQVIYPKDIGPILLIADIHPGARVLESGVGSGALSAALLRAGADLLGYEIREDFANRARKNVEGFLGAEVAAGWQVEVRDVYEGIEATDLDRVVLDLPEGPFGFAETTEVLHRGWYIEGQAVRPNHRMVAHTGFLTSARLLG
jgi:tRNA (adenine57-N1/adenine58-N1)-methyltransferase